MPDLSAKQLSSLQTILQRVCPSVAAALSEQLHTEAVLGLLDVRTVPLSDLLGRQDHVVQTLFTFSHPEGSESVIILSEETGRIFVDMMEGMSGGDPTEPLTDSNVDTLSGGMTALVRGLSLGLHEISGDHYDIESSNTHAGMLTVPPVFALDGSAIEVKFAVTIPEIEDLEIAILFTSALMLELTPTADQAPGAAQAEAGPSLSEDDVAAMLSQVAADDDLGFGGAPAPAMAASAAPFADLGYRTQEALQHRGLDMILDIPLDVTVELGRVRMLIKDVLELSAGSIIELDRVAGEPVDLLVNGRLVAKGEVVVIEDNFGIRITEIVSPAERVAGLSRGDKR